jgi:hypothetical protein
MADNIRGIPFTTDVEGVPYPEQAKKMLFAFIQHPIKKTHPTFSVDEIYVVWFAYVLGAWKALLSTSIPDGRYYEITFNKDKSEIYIDTYEKIDNIGMRHPWVDPDRENIEQQIDLLHGPGASSYIDEAYADGSIFNDPED